MNSETKQPDSSGLEWAHSLVRDWFVGRFGTPTEPQLQGWPHILAGKTTLISAPTGSGKTLAAFLICIDRLVRKAISGELLDRTEVLYVSPLKALSNDIQKNLEVPLGEILQLAGQRGMLMPEIRTAVRTGDTLAHERRAMLAHPPHILVTTPESLYILLTAARSREVLRTVESVIVDEIHAVADDKRGAHLALSLERLDHLTGKRLPRIGLSATQKPIELVADFLTGAEQPAPHIVQIGHRRELDLAVEVPGSELGPVASNEMWDEIYDRLARLATEHRSTLIFVNTRRMSERMAHHLGERLGKDAVAAHHGSLSRNLRLAAERKLKAAEIRALVATASLELGIDIGSVDLVCQIGSPRSIAAALQRIGRAGHWRGAIPKGRFFVTTRDDLLECAALVRAIGQGDLDRIAIPEAPMDILAQQIVAMCAAEDWKEDELFQSVRRAYPYRHLARADFEEIVEMLSEGMASARGRYAAYLHRDRVNGVVRARRGSRLAAITSGGAIPENSLYTVVAQPEGTVVGTVDEDFGVESLAGDIMLLGNTSWRIRRVQAGKVLVEDAAGAAPNVPFWRGEAPSRTDELSAHLSELREKISAFVPRASSNSGMQAAEGVAAAVNWLKLECGLDQPGAEQAVEYVIAGRALLGAVPTQTTVIAERFFDESGGMQLIIHAPFGARINKAWGLALRKRFCRSFNFELQAAATDNGLNISLSEQHSFPLADVFHFLHSNTARSILVQAVCAAPMFPVRWRWSAAIALALPRFRGGKKVPAPLARMAAEDLLAAVFPDQLACAENLPGELEIPDHPLVRQTLRDCLEEAMDAGGFERLLRALESGGIQVLARDLTEPSPLALEVLSARPYAYLDDAPLEERRTQAVMSRRWLDPQSAADLGKLDAEAIRRVREEAWPDATDADELHDALLWLTYLTDAEVARGAGWTDLIAQLAAQRRVTHIVGAGAGVWVTAERLPLFAALFPAARPEPAVTTPAGRTQSVSSEAALVEAARGRLEGLGPTTAAALAAELAMPTSRIETALAALQAEGFAMRGAFTDTPPPEGEWCERRLLARIHGYTVKRLRAEIEPIEARDFVRFLLDWQRVTLSGRMEGPDAVGAVLAQLEGFEAPASAWETEILPARIGEYEPAWLDEQCLAGRFVWTRLAARRAEPGRGAAPVRSTPIVLLARRHLRLWSSLAGTVEVQNLSPPAQRVAEYLSSHGASFFDEIAPGSSLLPSQAEEPSV